VYKQQANYVNDPRNLFLDYIVEIFTEKFHTANNYLVVGIDANESDNIRRNSQK